MEPFPLGVLGFGALPVFFSWPRTLGLAFNICVGWENVTEFDEGGLLVNVCEDDGSDWNRKGGRGSQMATKKDGVTARQENFFEEGNKSTQKGNSFNF